MKHQHQHAGQAHTETTVSWSAVLKEVQVGFLEAFWVKALLLGLLNQDVDSVLTLSSRGDLGATPNLVVTVGQARVVGVTHVIERANAGWVVGDKHKLVTKGLGNVGGNLALALRV